MVLEESPACGRAGLGGVRKHSPWSMPKNRKNRKMVLASPECHEHLSEEDLDEAEDEADDAGAPVRCCSPLAQTTAGCSTGEQHVLQQQCLNSYHKAVHELIHCSPLTALVLLQHPASGSPLRTAGLVCAWPFGCPPSYEQ